MRYRLRHDRLRRELARRKISQNRWAQVLGLGKSHLSMLLNGIRPYPSRDTRDKLLRGLDLHLEELFVAQPDEHSPRGLSRMDALLQDLTHAWRSLRRRPGFASVIVVTLALGIAATTTIYSVVDATLLRPLPFPDADRLVRVYGVNPERGFTRGQLSMANVIDWRTRAHTLESIATYRARTFNLSGSGEPERVLATLVSDGFLSMVGLDPVLGRGFTAAEHREGGDAVVLISDGLWERRFERDPTVIGRTVRIDTTEHTIVGVLPPDSGALRLAVEQQTMVPELVIPVAVEPDVNRGAYWMLGMARLAPGASLVAAQAEITDIAAQIEREYPDAAEGHQVLLMPLREAVGGDMRTTLWLFLGAVVAVLLVACVNAASLMIAYASSRRRDMVVRQALGAGKLRLIRLTLTESLLLGVLGGGLGVLLAGLTLAAARPLLPEGILRADQVGLDLRVLGFSVALSLATAVAFGFLPSIRLAAASAGRELTAGITGGESPRRLQLLRMLVVAQIALAGTVAVGAGLVAKSYSTLLAVDPGFASDRLLTFYTIPRYSYDTQEGGNEFVTALIRRLENLPGVEAAGEVNFLPFSDNESQFGIEIEDRPNPGGVGQWGQLRAADDGFFAALGLEMIEGRALERADMQGAQVAVINDTMANRYWPEGDAVGRRFRLLSSGVWYRVVGIAPTITWHAFGEDALPRYYLPYVDDPLSTRGFLLRTTGDPLLLVDAVRETVSALNSNQSIHGLETMQQRIDDSVADTRFALLTVMAFATTALVLALVGTYAVLSYAVSRRTAEIGLRLALGPRPGSVRRLMIRQSAVLAGAGLLLALVVGRLLAGTVSALLFRVSPNDISVLGAVALVVLAGAGLAAWVPARRAAGIDPASALRE